MKALEESATAAEAATSAEAAATAAATAVAALPVAALATLQHPAGSPFSCI